MSTGPWLEMRGPRPHQETRPTATTHLRQGYSSPTIRVQAFAEVTITPSMLDHGFLTDRSLQQIRHDLDGIPDGARVVVHLPAGMREPDELLCEFLAGLPCPISFGGNWRAADAAQQMVDELRQEVA